MENPKFKKCLQWSLLVVLLAILAFTVWQITQDIFFLSHSGFRRARRDNGPGTAVQMSPDQIQVWMTFRYVNLVFRLPESYLQNELDISDKRYPNISISVLAKEQKKTAAAELLAIQQAIKAQ